jgi:uncharacterized protein YjbI with pentapeptide repeats
MERIIMNTDIQNITGTEDKPLERADVENLLREVGSPDRLNLSGRNLNGINLSELNLSKANLSGANLGGANLREAILSQANLRKADLRQADLVRTNLRSADLHGANLKGATIGLANLTRADLSNAYLLGSSLGRANLHEAILREATLSYTSLNDADLSGADLYRAILDHASLFGANLSGADLRGVDLSNVDLTGANLAEAYITDFEREQLRDNSILGFNESNAQIPESASAFRIRIIEEPLTAQNLTTIISVLTELYTKCWLIAKGRLGNLIEYTQTHNVQFVEEANLVITKLTHNSPAEMELAPGKSADTKSKLNSPVNVDVKVEATPEAVMKALGIAIDGVVQAPLRFKEKQLEIQAKAQKIKQAEQKAAQESQMALLEKEKQEFENEKLRLELVEKRLEVQKKGIDYALEVASKMVDVLYPNADAGTKAMITRTLLPGILQLDNVKGLELVLPVLQSSGEETETIENG